MERGILGRLALVIGLVASAGAAGCFWSEEETGSSDDEVTAGTDVSQVLKSTLILEEGCIATKVGRRQLLVAARCVADNPAFAVGKKLAYKIASAPNAVVARDNVALGETDGGASNGANDSDGGASNGADDSDGGASNGANDSDDSDGGASNGANDSDDSNGGASNGGASNGGANAASELKIKEIAIHSSYETKCEDQACAFGVATASDAKDIAVIILDGDLEGIPTIPVDLDPVGKKGGDPVLAVGSGCAKLDASPKATKTYKTVAVPARLVEHEGSSYTSDDDTKRLDAAYVVTPAIGWKSGELELCKNDIGAPLFRAESAAIVGVASNFSTFAATNLAPVTVHYTRVDKASTVGAWLASHDVETTNSCSETERGCKEHTFDGPGPRPPSGSTTGTNGTTEPGEEDGGEPQAPATDGGASDDDDDSDDFGQLPPRGDGEQLGEGEDPYVQRTNDGEGYDAGAKKKKKKQASGCSATPGGTGGTMGGSLAFAFGMAAFAAAARRRRAR